jgi:(1->4)-alpha-D-glucan 1-alpha-D-glucosylmutase
LAFDRFVATLAEHDLGLIVDVVPHHMSIVGPGNRWWWEVLTFGSQASTADWFDVDWHSDDERSRARVVLPILGDHYGRSLEDGTIRLARRDDGAFVVCAHDQELPVAPFSLTPLLREVGDLLGHGRLVFLADALAIADPAGSFEALRLLGEVEAADADVPAEIEKALVRTNGDADALDAIVDAQHYRLAKWTVAASELDYRRFFDINSLIALRSERDDVFAATHALVIGWARDGIVDGLRIDHVDGLRDPTAYLDRLRAAVGPDVLIFVEKILSRDESLPAWPVEGTTGYDAAAAIGAVLVDGDGAERLRESYVAFTGLPQRYREVSEVKRRLALRSSLASDLERLTSLLVQVCTRRRRARDFTRVELREALRETIVHAPAYRSYVTVRGDEVEWTLADMNYIDLAIARAREARQDLDGELFDLLRSVLLAELDLPEALDLALRAQQLTGSAVAKGDEDAAHYTWGPLLSANEVGSDPDQPSMSVADFHTWVEARAASWPEAMTSTATHDSKRSEDVRVRLAVLSETPEEWTASIERWWQHTAAWRGPLVDPAIGSIILQTLVGAHPLPLDRASEYVRKAMREAKEHTSWTAPDPRYESQVEDFVAGVLADPDLSAELTALSAEIEEAAQVNALTQVTLRLTLPGFPDTYQGTELWDDSLVDPDNRRPVDFDRRRRMLDHAREMDAASAWREERRSGLPKLLLIDKLLHLRAERPRSFGPGGVYEPLEVADDRAIAFVRGGDVAVVVPRLSLRGQSPARVALPRGEWRDLLSDFPVAVLERA